MVGCSAFGCQNRNGPDMRLFRFPRDPERRKIWEKKVRRASWSANDNHRLCQVHFLDDQFESNRKDGWKKLKSTAVPTIFCHRSVPRCRKAPLKRSSDVLNTTTEDVRFGDHTYSNLSRVEPVAKLHLQDAVQLDGEESSTSTSMEPADCSSTPAHIEPADILDIPVCEEIVVSSTAGEDFWRQQFSALAKQFDDKQQQLENLQKTHDSLSRRINNIFNEDQLMTLSSTTGKMRKWSKETVQKSLRIRFSCGTRGYDDLIEHGFPLPSLRTLRRHIEGLCFDSGTLDDIFCILKHKVEAMSVNERECALTLDEMKISPKVEYDKSSDKFVGTVTLPNHGGLAENALVIMLSGLTTRWKQAVAYYFTGSSTNGSVLKELVINVIVKAESIGLRVASVTSDMGPANVAMWKAFGVGVSKTSGSPNPAVKCCVKHPADPQRELYFFADPPHLLKNIRNFLLSNQQITIPAHLIDKFELNSNSVTIQPVHMVYQMESANDLKLAPNLTAKVLNPGRFEKMRVGPAKTLFHQSISASIRYMVEEKKLPPSSNTTAWFLETVRMWFELMTSNSIELALSYSKKDIYDNTIKFLSDIITIFSSSKFGNAWKPFQSGVILSVTSLLQYHRVFLETHPFLLTCRFTQDCLENLFSCVRIKCPVPSALQFRQNLKLITVSQYLKPSSSGSYDPDDSTFLADELTNKENRSSLENDSDLILVERDVNCQLPEGEEAPVYYISGYCVHKVLNTIACEACKNATVRQGSEGSKYSSYVEYRNYKENLLVHPSSAVSDLLSKAEELFKTTADQVLSCSSVRENLLKLFWTKFSRHLDLFPKCHNVANSLLTTYFNLRCHCHAKSISKAKKGIKSHSSKTVAMHALN